MKTSDGEGHILPTMMDDDKRHDGKDSSNFEPEGQRGKTSIIVRQPLRVRVPGIDHDLQQNTNNFQWILTYNYVYGI